MLKPVVLSSLTFLFLYGCSTPTVSSDDVDEDVPVLSSSGQEDHKVSSSSSAAEPEFVCDGRQYCSQMNSYEEAVFFVKNCPDTKMDGDDDGRPCESQFGK